MRSRLRRVIFIPCLGRRDAPFHATDEWFQQKLESHTHMVALYFVHFNFCRVHKTLRVTPAMEAGIANHVWTIEELTTLLRGQIVEG
jgi:hypothetical protein